MCCPRKACACYQMQKDGCSWPARCPTGGTCFTFFIPPLLSWKQNKIRWYRPSGNLNTWRQSTAPLPFPKCHRKSTAPISGGARQHCYRRCQEYVGNNISLPTQALPRLVIGPLGPRGWYNTARLPTNGKKWWWASWQEALPFNMKRNISYQKRLEVQVCTPEMSVPGSAWLTKARIGNANQQVQCQIPIRLDQAYLLQ